MKLHKAYVNDSYMRSDGLGWFVQFGESITVNDKPSVDLGHAIVSADGWHEDRAEAVRDAAYQIEQIGRRLLAQADQMRAEAREKKEVADGVA